MAELMGKRILTIVSNRGVEQDELVGPAGALRAAGADVTICAPSTAPVETLVHDWDRGTTVSVDAKLAEVSADDYDLLLIPGGTLNADALRLDPNAQAIATQFASSGRPIAAICHGPWLLVETGLVRGKQLTSYASLRTDVTNAGGTWHDSELVRCDHEGFVLFTSRGPQDLDAFTEGIQGELGRS
ncbi:DJ-1/PfpI/YhbO family deglycase/protease [Pseudactinotalea sp. HY160]|uniref:type 1 glutamine amidotransferase domain-containing protein n=1 Tax=Pseudactinotalea sp. HY160 TaxID=2654490 RepID=UPI00128C9983|nr:type 1 glutamine amidotransferase domain-containing protein [Pseudactinotalea sp. HY160]MPV50992.1 DJ-1/PfpI/YhbO family deglycase/protease [Pseudactinotalea sp. HY160]